MNVQSLIPFTPFLAVLYVLYAFIQSLRKKRQGIIAALLALIALVVPIIGIVLAETPLARIALVEYLTLNGIIVFIGSFIVLMIERRNPSRPANRSYGILGIALSALIAVEIFVYPLLAGSLGGRANNTAAQGDNSTLENISQTTSGQATAFGQLAAKQTGLTVEDLTTQLQSGSTIADLVTKNKGDLDAVTKAAATALDDLTKQGGIAAQMMSRLGTNSTAIATQFVQGNLQARAQTLLTTMLMTGAAPSFGGRQNGTGGSGAGGNGNFQRGNGSAEATADPAASGGNGTAATGGSGRPGRQNAGAEATADPSGAAGGSNGTANTSGSGRPGRQNGSGGSGNFPQANGTPAPNQNGSQVALQPTAQPTSIPATPVIRPTVITFPTLEPIDEATVAAPDSSAESTADPSAASAVSAAAASNGTTCIITPIYNLNLRDAPNTDGKIYLSIPFSTQVTADGHTSDNWYSVTYNDQKGWVSGEYVATDGQCDKLPVVNPS